MCSHHYAPSRVFDRPCPVSGCLDAILVATSSLCKTEMEKGSRTRSMGSHKIVLLIGVETMRLLSAQCELYSSIVLTQSHPPLRLSFHKLTLLSPPLTARTLPLRLQLTRQTTASNLSSVLCQLDELAGSAFA